MTNPAAGTIPVELIEMFLRGASDRPRRGPGMAPVAVIGEEDRQLAEELENKPPLDLICSVEARAADGRVATGTGWLAGPRIVVTAAHVLRSGSFAASAVKVRLVHQGSAPQRQWATGSAPRWHPNWTGNPSDPSAAPFDLATISLPAEMAQTRWFAMAAWSDSQLADHWLNIAGYPAKVHNTPTSKMWWHAGRIGTVDPSWLLYQNDTSEGQSGAPALAIPESAPLTAAPTAVGLHVRGRPNFISPTHNAALRLTDELIVWIGAAS